MRITTKEMMMMMMMMIRKDIRKSDSTLFHTASSLNSSSNAFVDFKVPE